MDERLRRWRMVLGGGEADGTGCGLQGDDAAMDGALAAVYGEQGDHDNAAALAALGAPAFACTPDAFPGLMAAAIERRDIAQWAERHLGTGS